MGPKRTAEKAAETQPASKREKTDTTPKEGHPLLIDDTKGMNPVTLLTGYYGSRGEHIRHVVHEGALRMPQEVLKHYALPSKNHRLPELDSVERPTQDPQRRKVIITHISKEIASGDSDVKKVMKTKIENRLVPTVADDETRRIRGGGGEELPDNNEDREMGDASLAEDDNPLNNQVAADEAGPSPLQVNAQEQPAATDTTAPPPSLEPQPQPSNPTPSSQGPQQSDETPTVENRHNKEAVQTPETEAASVATPSAQGSALLAPTSSDQTKHNTIARAVETSPRVQGLSKVPAPSWEQHVPGPNDEMVVDESSSSPRPEWFLATEVSSLERAILPEWFNGSAPHRTESSYLKARAQMIRMSGKLGTRYLTATLVRRAIPGDAGSLMRLHSFLTSHSLINEHSINDSAPFPVSMQEPTESTKAWDDDLKNTLLEAVVAESKSDKSATGRVSIAIDWNVVATTVGYGKTPSDCQQQFLSMPIAQEKDSTQKGMERPITPDSHAVLESADQEKSRSNEFMAQMLQQLVEKCDSKVVDAVTQSALKSTRGALAETREAVPIGLFVSQSEQEAQKNESFVAGVVSEIVELRMKKLENRLSLLDDVEGILEAERAALEIERRDLYTTRCRHWFQGP